jgi:hypothetical protein
VLKKRDEQRLEAAKMKFLRHLLEIIKLDREREKPIREGETWVAEHCSGNKTVLTSVATTCGENGHRQDTQTGTEI